MAGFVLKKIAYGFLVLLGVVTVVFFIFNLGGDPVENLVSENTSLEVKQAIKRKYNLDLSAGKRYLIYLNDLSPLSVHNTNDSHNRIYLDSSKYSSKVLFSVSSNKVMVLKYPFLNRSYLSDRPVSDILSEALPGTAVLALTAISIALLLGLLLGAMAALRKDTWLDQLAVTLSAVGMSGPSFFMAILIAWLGGVVGYESISLPIIPVSLSLFFPLAGWMASKMNKNIKDVSLGKLFVVGLLFGVAFVIIGKIVGQDLWTGVSWDLPGTGLPMSGSLFDVDVWKGRVLCPKNLILPAITLGIRPMAVVVQLTRSSLLDVLSQDYIRTAKAKGLSLSRVVFNHAIKNALNPVITAISGWFASMLAGAVFVEFVFGWKGLGLETYNALEKDDFPVVMGAVVVIALIFVVVNLLTDLLYGVIDPRVRG